MIPRFILGGGAEEPFLELLPSPFQGFAARIFLRGPLTEASMGGGGREWKRRLERAAGNGWPPDWVAPHQVHGTAFVEGRGIWSLPARPQADGVLSSRGGSAGVLRFADCWPVLIASSDPPFALGLHSGYRGTLAGIVPRALRALNGRFGEGWRRSARVWVGPGIGGCCYDRRREDVSLEIARRVLPAEALEERGPAVKVDLGLAIRSQLLEGGIDPEDIGVCDSCTFCGPLPSCSYRRGDGGRMILLFSADHRSTFEGETGEC